MTRPREDRFDELFPGSQFTREECEFLRAIDRYKRQSGRIFLSWHEVLRLAKQLGYRKVYPALTPIIAKPRKKTQKSIQPKCRRHFSSHSRY